MATAKVFRSGDGQAVLLPQEFRFPPGTQEVSIHRDGDLIVLEPVSKWSKWPDSFWLAFEGMSEDFERPDQGPPDRPIESFDD